MAKNIVYNLSLFNYQRSDFKEREEMLFKKLALMFDSIYFEENEANDVLGVQTYDKSRHIVLGKLHDASLIEYLLDVNVAKTHKKTFSYSSSKSDEESDERISVIEGFNKLFPQEIRKMKGLLQKPVEEVMPLLKDIGLLQPDGLEKHHDLTTRSYCIDFNEASTDEFHPLLVGQYSFQQSSKETSVIQMILKQIPEPHPETAWEQILDFRDDEDVRNKYLSLINWVNKVSSSSTNFKHLYDEYEYLYSEYVKHLKLHKLKTTNSVVEMILTAGIDFIIGSLAGNYFSSAKSLVQISRTRHELLKQENHLGRELAYIYEVNKRFGESK